METIQASFITGAVSPEQFPVHTLPEVAMIGRSNVGKSSLINRIVLQGNVARVSNTPGKTREINFFNTSMSFVLVDLPGYGYARVSKQHRAGFSVLIRQYLIERPNMALACVLVDSRHDPMESDLAMIEELEFAGRPYSVLLTKTDKLKPAQVKERTRQMRHLLEHCKHCVDVIATSSETGEGRSSVLGMIKRLCSQFNKPS